jgi:hypothetical protein
MPMFEASAGLHLLYLVDDSPTPGESPRRSGCSTATPGAAWPPCRRRAHGRGSELLVIPGNSYHVAASDAERCAEATLDFIARRGAA